MSSILTLSVLNEEIFVDLEENVMESHFEGEGHHPYRPSGKWIPRQPVLWV